MAERTISWLHFTDLHLGQGADAWLWPGVKDLVFEDLKQLHDRCGPWDLVLLTGDLTQRGSPEEYVRANDVLGELWALLEGLGSSPALLSVPGNHDLERPSPRRPESLLMGRWDEFPEIRDEFWRDASSPYRRLIDEVFSSYSNWSVTHPFPRVDPYMDGLLPGDFAAVLRKDGLQLGVIGLNSAFLQLQGGDYSERLALDVRQFNAVCEGDGPAWARRNHINLLLSHHPPSWLSTAAQAHVRAEIATPGRFMAHVFGHMHESAQVVLSRGASKAERLIQGCSLFGLESFGEGDGVRVERRHGFAAARVEVRDDGAASLRLWPRVARRKTAGHWRIIQDIDAFELEDDHGTAPEVVELLRDAKRVAKPAPPTPPTTSPKAQEPADSGATTVVTADPEFAMSSPQDAGATDDASDPATDTSGFFSIESRIQPPGAPYNRTWHVHRAEEEQTALNYLDQPGAPVVLWGPEKFGKTWMSQYLMECVHQRDGANVKVISINLDTFDHESRRDYAHFIQELAFQIVAATGGNEDWVQNLWEARGSVNQKLGRLMQRHILPLASSRLILALDRVDAVWGLPFKDDCFGMLRAWAQDQRLGKLRLILAISTTPSRLIDRPTQSPFNLTPPIVLGDFTIGQVRALARAYGLHWTDRDFHEIMALIGGHPYLIRHVMHRSVLTGGTPAGELINESTSLFDDFLQRYSRRLHAQPELLAAMRSLRSEEVHKLEPEVSIRLESAGLAIEEEAGYYRLRYRLYERLRV
ncbi:MAG: AAA-like domain-containing protein [Nannocystaceae bacterium]|nr:AAA-like domain-containing protein [Myxococcales bacterium]